MDITIGSNQGGDFNAITADVFYEITQD